MVLSPNVNATSLGASSVTSQAETLAGITSSITSDLANIGTDGGDIVIPIYRGGTMLDEVIVNAQQRANLRSEGR